MLLGLVGKPNVGKSTFFVAATLAPAQIADYPFTTVQPNRGVAHVKAQCPHTALGTACNPKSGRCEDGVRFVAVEVLDVAGLVPGAHEGKGLGNQFLDDLSRASALLHIIDASGSSGFDGNAVPEGSHDPLEDMKFLEREIVLWIKAILSRGFDKVAKRAEIEGSKIETHLAERLTGLGISEGQVHAAVRAAYLPEKAAKWKDEELLSLAQEVRKISKPMMVVGNKWDRAPEARRSELLQLKGLPVVPAAAEYELALRRAAKAGIVRYLPGDGSFNVAEGARLSPAQRAALEKIAAYLKESGSTGVQAAVETAVFKLLDMVVVYPVEDEGKWTDRDGNVLPDAHLMKRGSTARDLAYRVHTELGQNFIRAVNGRTRRIVGAEYELQDGDVIKIVA